MASKEYKKRVTKSAIDELKKKEKFLPLEDLSCIETTSNMIAEQAMEPAIKSALLTLKLQKELKKKKPEKMGMFTLNFSGKGLQHSECPIQVEFCDPQGNTLATAGFFIQAGKPKELQIVNLQSSY